MTIGDNIRKKRKEQNLLQSELAALFNKEFNKYANKKKIPQKNIDKRTISNWENGISSPNVEYVPFLCKVLKTDANELLDLDSIKEKLFTKKILLDDGSSIEIVTEVPWEQLPEEQQKEIMDSVIEESVKIKKESSKKDS